jgi:hypothetical protein
MKHRTEKALATLLSVLFALLAVHWSLSTLGASSPKNWEGFLAYGVLTSALFFSIWRYLCKHLPRHDEAHEARGKLYDEAVTEAEKANP